MLAGTRLTAHVGCDGTKHNSGELLRHAMALPVDLAEVPVRRDPDGALKLAHDGGQAGAPLADALTILLNHPEKKLNCDLRQRGLEAAVWALARETGVGGQIALSGEVSALAALEAPGIFDEVEWHVKLEDLFPEISEPSFKATLTALRVTGMADRIELFLSDHHAHCVSAHYRLEETRLYPELLRRRIPLSIRMPDDEQAIRRFLGDGVYNVTTRSAALACRLRESLLLMRAAG